MYRPGRPRTWQWEWVENRKIRNTRYRSPEKLDDECAKCVEEFEEIEIAKRKARRIESKLHASTAWSEKYYRAVSL